MSNQYTYQIKETTRGTKGTPVIAPGTATYAGYIISENSISDRPHTNTSYDPVAPNSVTPNTVAPNAGNTAAKVVVAFILIAVVCWAIYVISGMTANMKRQDQMTQEYYKAKQQNEQMMEQMKQQDKTIREWNANYGK